MAGRGSQTFKKRQKEQRRKERQQIKLEKRMQRRQDSEKREQLSPEMGQPIVPTPGSYSRLPRLGARANVFAA